MQTVYPSSNLTKYTRLEALGVRVMEPRSTTAQFNTYREQLTSLTQQLKPGSDREEALALAKAWLPLIRFGVTESASPGMYQTYFKIFTGLLVNHNIVGELTRDRLDMTILEGLAMLNAMLDEKVTPGKRFGAAEIIGQWLGEKPRSSKVASLESVVEFLYGPLAWDVYNNGETQPYKTIHAILKERLPIVANRPAPASTISSGSLPGDMSL